MAEGREVTLVERLLFCAEQRASSARAVERLAPAQHALGGLSLVHQCLSTSIPDLAERLAVSREPY